jgi:hypothetical protein
VIFQHQAEPWLGSIFTSLTEPSHEPARLGSIPPLIPDEILDGLLESSPCVQKHAVPTDSNTAQALIRFSFVRPGMWPS